MTRLPPALIDVLEHADYPATGDRLRQLAVARDAPEVVVEQLGRLPAEREFSDAREVRDGLGSVLAVADLDEPEAQTLTAVAELEAGDGAPEVGPIARRTGLSTDEVEAALASLTRRDLVREIGDEPGTAGAPTGRRYTLKQEPHPPGA